MARPQALTPCATKRRVVLKKSFANFRGSEHACTSNSRLPQISRDLWQDLSPNRFSNRESPSIKQKALPITTAFEFTPLPHCTPGILGLASASGQTTQGHAHFFSVWTVLRNVWITLMENPGRVYHRVTHTPTTPRLHQQQILKKA